MMVVIMMMIMVRMLFTEVVSMEIMMFVMCRSHVLIRFISLR